MFGHSRSQHQKVLLYRSIFLTDGVMDNSMYAHTKKCPKNLEVNTHLLFSLSNLKSLYVDEVAYHSEGQKNVIDRVGSPDSERCIFGSKDCLGKKG